MSCGITVRCGRARKGPNGLRVDYCLAKVTFAFWVTLHGALGGEVDIVPTICVVPLNVPLKARVHCAAATSGVKVIATVEALTVPDNWPPLMLMPP